MMQVINLTPRFARSVHIARLEAQGQSVAGVPGADEEDDEDTMKGMARLFAEIGEAYTTMIAQGKCVGRRAAVIDSWLAVRSIK